MNNLKMVVKDKYWIHAENYIIPYWGNMIYVYLGLKIRTNLFQLRNSSCVYD